MSENKEYWNKRANQDPKESKATFYDVFLRKKEIEEISKYIEKYNPKTFLDIGCGNGHSTIQFAKKFPDTQFKGIDYSENMINDAKEQSKDISNVSFEVVDILKYDSDDRFEMASSCRCLINLSTKEAQFNAIKSVRNHLTQGGRYIMLESFEGGYSKLNELRKNYGLEVMIPSKLNIYFNEEEVSDNTKDIFKITEINNFSSTYYLGSRVIYPLILKDFNQDPKHDHIVNSLFSTLGVIGEYGREKIFVLEAI